MRTTLLLCLLSLAPVAADPVPRFRQLCQEAVQATGVPGMSVTVVHRGKVIFQEGFGVRTVGGTEPVTVDTVFQLASCSKPVTSAALAALVGQGKFTFDSLIQDLDPDFRLADPWVTGHLTLRDLLSHRSGLPGAAGNELESLGVPNAEIRRRLRYVPLGNRFRSAYSYSNFGLTEGADAAARAAGTTYPDMLDTCLFKPLGMSSSSGRDADFQRQPNRALAHVMVNGKPVQRYTRHPDAQAPAGGVSSTARDLSRFLLMQLGRGKFEGRQVVAEAALEETWLPVMRTGFNPATFSSGFYGLGWAVSYDEWGKTEVKHSGAFSTGSRSQILLLPDEELGIAIVSNAFPSGLPEGLSTAFLKLHFEGKAELADVLAVDKAVGNGMAGLLADGAAARPGRPAPPLPWSAYAGTYENGYSGTVAVTADGTLKVGDGSARLQPWDRDTFRWDAELSDGPLPTLVRFEVGPDGRAEALTLVDLDLDGTGRLSRRK